MLKAYQFRIYPTYKQRQTFQAQLDACQTLYNQALHMRKQQYERDRKAASYNAQAAMLTQLRKQSPFWSSLHIDILQDTLRRLDKAFNAFFRRLKNGQKPGFPRFKGKGRYRSMTYSHLAKQLIRPAIGRLSRMVVPKVGQVKIRLHRPLPDGTIKNLTIQWKPSGWYACICVEVPDVPKVDIQSAVGIDVGLASFLTTSDGEKVNNPRYLRQAEQNLKKTQRRLSKRKKGSSRRTKIQDRIAKQHEHVTNQRRDFHCKTAHQLYSQYDAVVIEDLRITNMVQNHHLAYSISDAAWGHFTCALANKAEKAGLHLLKVPPHGTSQMCSGCGETVKKSLSVRTHRCDWCGLSLDRDHNAAINILRAASARRGGVLVANSPETLPLGERSEKPVSPCGAFVQAPPFRAG